MTRFNDPFAPQQFYDDARDTALVESNVFTPYSGLPPISICGKNCTELTCGSCMSYVRRIVPCDPIEFFTNYTKMPLLAFLSLLHENKKSSDKMLLPVGIEPRPLIMLIAKTFNTHH